MKNYFPLPRINFVFCISFLLFTFGIIFRSVAADVTIQVRNQNGNIPAEAATRVKVVRWEGATYKETLSANSNGEVTFSNLSMGSTFRFDAYYEGQNAFDEDGELWFQYTHTVQSSNQTISINRELPYVEILDFLVGGQIVNPDTMYPVGTVVEWRAVVLNRSSSPRNTRVTMRIDLSETATLDYEYKTDDYQSVNADSTIEFRGSYTLSNQGKYYAAVKTECNLDLGKTDSWDWAPRLLCGTPRADVTVRVRTPSGEIPVQSATRLKLERWIGINCIEKVSADSNGEYTFSSLPVGSTQTFDAYYEGPNAFDAFGEFWVQKMLTVQSGSQTLTMNREMPYVEALNFYLDGQIVNPDTQIPSGNTVVWQAIVRNRTAIARNARVTVRVDQSKTLAWDYESTNAYQSVNSGNTKTFQGSFTVPNSGLYYAAVKTEIDQGMGKSDSWDWAQRLTVVEHTLSPPGAPNGPSSGYFGNSLWYMGIGASYCSVGHYTNYRFDWGDGSFSSWGTSTYLSHSYSDCGQNDKQVKVTIQCKCSTAQSIVAISNAKDVTISRPKAGSIIGASTSAFSGVARTVAVTVSNRGRDDGSLIVAPSGIPQGWSIAPSSMQAVVTYNTTNSNYFTFTITPPAYNSSTAITWKLSYVATNMIIHTYSQSVNNSIDVSISESGSTTVDTRSVAKIDFLSLEGDVSIPSGAVRDYHLIAHFSDGSTSDVTGFAKWEIISTPASAGTSFYHNSLYAGAVTSRQCITITASYYNTGSGETRTERMDVSLEPIFAVSFSQQAHYFLGMMRGYWTVNFRADSVGPNGGAVDYAWDMDGDSLFNDGTGVVISNTFNVGRSYLVGVKATDNQGQTAIAQSYITLSQEPADPEVEIPVPAVDVTAGMVLDSGGNTYIPDANKANIGLIILVHGMTDSATVLDVDGKNWMQTMGQAIANRLGSNSPNICLFDWSTIANPAQYDNEQIIIGGVGGFLHDVRLVRPYGLVQGQVLANWIKTQITLGNVRSDRPIHLIGHSAGGFVTGECGLILGSIISQVTMLDTPMPVITHFSNYPNAGGLVERYISSEFGAMCDQFLTDDDEPSPLLPIWSPLSLPRIHSDARYSRTKIRSWWDLLPLPAQHSDGHEWYRTNTIDNGAVDGFYYSPFLNNGFHGASRASLLAIVQASKVSMMAETTPPDEPITGFQAFGAVTVSNGLYTLTEQVDVGLAKQMTIPIGAQSLKFRFQFISPGDGDFLAVYWGTNNPVLYIGLDLPLTREAFLEADVPVKQFAGQSNQLAFVLTSRGETNAVLTLDQIRFSMSDDPDGDGLATDQELALGTDPLKYDTDGDGLSDGDEVNIYHTNPLLVDSDVDGVPDGMEIAAGTDPNEKDSVLKITGLTVGTNGLVDLQWSGATNRLYRVNSSTSLNRDTYTTLINNFPSNRVSVSGSSVGVTNSTGFFWIEMDDLP